MEGSNRFFRNIYWSCNLFQSDINLGIAFFLSVESEIKLKRILQAFVLEGGIKQVFTELICC
ncbi:hypothetical protein VIBHAR_05178 [Vibrio campbellii ATCC BAA-1116]|uniref:Uncharacterized protein n=1 Tax=Vibrio campbellii (strain ATCC BAA-1116) TaxID=2902295 RepID=A7N687_VIBC1|nr:hypothetical protein VIBHAR_05178 [Vibrio campbellii ATCC BAA-1116]